MTTMYGPGSPYIKSEPGRQGTNEEQNQAKQESGSFRSSPTAPSDEDIYEDTGDLDFGGAIQGLYLARVPKYLWENWSTLEDDQEIRLGTVRVEGETSDIGRMSLMLSSEVAKNKKVPKEYNMNVTNSNAVNTFVFTEKDLPGFSSKMQAGVKQGRQGGGIPPSQMPRPAFQNRSRQNVRQADKSKRHQPYFRRAIPKQTSLAGQIKTEISCLPVENEEYRTIMEERARQGVNPKRVTQFLPGPVSTHGGNVLAPGTLDGSKSFGGFIKHTGPSRGQQQQSKAARIPQNELLDLIYECFRRYNYWSLKSLKDELNQPEAYLKQTLEMVAHLVRQGQHAMTWTLKPESKIGEYSDMFDKVKDEAAPSFDGPSDFKDENGGTDEDDDNVKMEDVLS